ncbi:putative oxidoreductase [Rhodotorula diobovata]|uniref:Putative oxidoreductase n=1 Tax=Rhodotorula diobovata TaxID=5288 RepID=A0A5C5FVD7_9BASI|nr:putative oxidoreductase [Rhodotorula diobovata]
MSSSESTRPYQHHVVVVGGSYVGLAVANELLKLETPPRVTVVERNSHFSHLFAYPRFAISPGSEHKAFVPFHPMLAPPHTILRANVTSLDPSSRTLALERVGAGETLSAGVGAELQYDALVLATGTTLSPPGTMPGSGDKADGVKYLRSIQGKLKSAEEIVIVGGGAVGVQMACDLAVLYPSKRNHITLVQSRRLMPRFHPALHDLVLKRFDELGVKTVLGVRAEVPEGGYEAVNERGGGEVKLVDGRALKADYVIHALGQSPNSQLLSSSLPSAVLPSRYVRVSPSLLVAPTAPTEASTVNQRIFALGDVADSGAPKAARPAIMGQAPLVARNIARVLAPHPEHTPAVELETHTPGPAAIHLTLGHVDSVVFRNPRASGTDERGEPRWEGEPEVRWRDDGVEDMGIESVWERRIPGFVTGPQSYHL